MSIGRRLVSIMWLVSLSLRSAPRASAAFTTSLLQQRSFAGGVSRHKKAKVRKYDQQRHQTPTMKKGPKNISNRAPLFRADRVLSNRGWGTRSECHQVLKQRRVRVKRGTTDMILKGPSDRIDMDDEIWVDGKPIPTIPLLLAYHKPKWVLSVMSDPQGRPCLENVLPEQYQTQDLHPVGRLDYDTSGLLLFSSNGPLTQKLLHPTHQVPKQYQAIVEGIVQQEELQEKLTTGVETTEGTHTAELVDVQHFNKDESEQVWRKVREGLPSDYNVTDLEVRGYLPENGDNSTIQLSQVRLVVREGKHRMVRRMLANCGHGVVELKREQQGEIALDDLGLEEFRNLTTAELEWAKSMVPKKGKKK